jgi:hypothetical protein
VDTSWWDRSLDRLLSIIGSDSRLLSVRSHRLPVAEFEVKQTAESRAALEIFLKKTGAQFWIRYDFVGNAILNESPDFYE